jgi:hypothetical protein
LAICLFEENTQKETRMLKAASVVVLSALLILSTPKHGTPVNNSGSKQAHTQPTGQSESTLTDKSVAQVEQPSAQVAETQPETTSAVNAPVVTPPTSHEELMAQAGIDQNDWAAANYIISHESSWREFAQEPTSGAYGLCQSLPAIKMASAGSDWQTNPVTQLKWCAQYANDRYGGWQGAYAHWLSFRWW